MKIRYLFILLIFLFSSSVAKGSYSGYYCRAKVTGETGKGKVYASYDPALMEVPEYSDSYTTPIAPTLSYVNKRVFYLYAKPESGYNLVTWKKGNNQIGQFPYVCDNFPYTRYEVTNISSTDKNSPTEAEFTAEFSSTWVTLSNPYPTTACTATINQPTNSNGTYVKLTANVSSNSNSTWVGWRDIHTGEIVSTLVNYTFTVDKKLDLEPLIKSSTLNIPDGFYCIKSAISNSDGKALELKLNQFNLTGVVGSAGSYDAEAATTRAQTQLREDLVLSDVSQSTPAGSVMYLKYMGNNTYDLFSQGVNLKKVTSGTHHGTNAGDANYEGSYLTVTDKGNGKYGLSIYISFSVNNMSETLTLYLKDKGDGQLYLEQTDDDSNMWSIEPITTPIKTISTTTLEDIKYTTLRSAFSYVIPNGSTTKAYKVESISDGLASLVEYEQGDTIYAGVPSILFYPSSESLNIIPVGNPSFKNDIGNVVLYNNYGTHKHDDTHTDAAGVVVRDGGEPRGDKIGYFAKETYSSGTLYRLSVNKNNVVGFWTPVSNDKISGNEAFSTVQCALCMNVDQLKELPETADQILYHVNEPLTVAYVDATNNVIYAKDDNGAPLQEAQNGEIDFMAEHYNSQVVPGSNPHYGDHSNWVAIKVASTADVAQKDVIEATGKVVDGTSPNRTIQGSVKKLDYKDNDYNPNTYCIANFFGTQVKNGQTYFFATPAANEIAEIIWAMWDDGYDPPCFVVPENGPGFEGAVEANLSLITPTPAHNISEVYKFLGLVCKKTEAKGNKAVSVSDQYVIYPLTDWEMMGDTSIPTAIGNINTNNVINVKYYNTMGLESDVPFNGINIVVTTYDNGTRTTSKILK